MSLAAYVKKSAEPELVTYEVLGVGGTTAVTEVTYTTSGVALSYVSTGRFRLTWEDKPGTFCGALATFQATTPADVKSYVAVFGAYDTSGYTLDVYLYEGGSLADLAALEWLNATVKFKRVTVAG